MAKPFFVSWMRRSTYAYVERLIAETRKGLAIVVDRPLEAIAAKIRSGELVGDQGAPVSPNICPLMINSPGDFDLRLHELCHFTGRMKRFCLHVERF